MPFKHISDDSSKINVTSIHTFLKMTKSVQLCTAVYCIMNPVQKAVFTQTLKGWQTKCINFDHIKMH